jgi:glutamate synthase (ferredoxin)
MSDLEKLEDPEEINDLRLMIQRHAELTGSDRAKMVLTDWDTALPQFVKVMPRDYKRVLQALAQAMADGLSGDEAMTAAFEANSRDVARIGGG